MKNWQALSDHTKGSVLGAIFRAHGCQFFEKHVDFVGGEKTPDSCVSMTADEFKLYRSIIRSTKPVDHEKRRKYARNTWGVQKTERGYFRPLVT